MGLVGFVAIRKLGYGQLKGALASPRALDVQRQMDRLAVAADEERLWRELKTAAQAMGLVSVRLSLMYKHEEDTVSIQREFGEWRGSDLNYGSLESSPAAATVKVEYLGKEPADLAQVHSLQLATEYACVRIFGKGKATKDGQVVPSQTMG
jgi:hypothetical protein